MAGIVCSERMKLGAEYTGRKVVQCFFVPFFIQKKKEVNTDRLRVLSGAVSKCMEIFSHVKFVKLLKEQEENCLDDIRILGIQMATEGETRELLKVPLEELKQAFDVLRSDVSEAKENIEIVEGLVQKIESVRKVAGPRRVW